LTSFIADMDACGEWKTRAIDDDASDDQDGDEDNTDYNKLRPATDENGIPGRLDDWAVMFNISQSALSKLLVILHKGGATI
jgi:hypothetical protein